MKRPRKRASSVAVIDIGSNSVRLVVYETMTRSLVTVFNEKALCGLGREVQSTGLLSADAVAKALTSLRRFRALCRIQQVGRVHAIATAACRDATNGPDRISMWTPQMRSALAMKSGPLLASRQAAVAIANTRPTFITLQSARKRRSEVSALATASAASRPVVWTSRPSPQSVFSLKTVTRLRVIEA